MSHRCESQPFGASASASAMTAAIKGFPRHCSLDSSCCHALSREGLRVLLSSPYTVSSCPSPAYTAGSERHLPGGCICFSNAAAASGFWNVPNKRRPHVIDQLGRGGHVPGKFCGWHLVPGLEESLGHGTVSAPGQVPEGREASLWLPAPVGHVQRRDPARKTGLMSWNCPRRGCGR